MKEDLLKELATLLKISPESLQEYKEKKNLLIQDVDKELEENPSLESLIGYNPLHTMRDNHKNHIEFMINVFQLQESSMLIKTLPWVYRSYHSRGFSYDYFIVVLASWIKAIKNRLTSKHAEQIVPIYQWIIGVHKTMISLSEVDEEETPYISKHWKETREKFLQAILEGKKENAVFIAQNAVHNKEDIIDFYIDVVQSCMHEIGKMWEKGKISVAQEHLASTIASHVVSRFYMMKSMSKLNQGKAIVTASPNEFHQLGAWMISDLLELDGWDVRYLGSNTPVQDLLDMISEFRPNIVFLSVTMSFNIIHAQEIIRQIRSKEILKDIKIMIGGLTIATFPELYKKLGADSMGLNARDAISMARQWMIQ